MQIKLNFHGNLKKYNNNALEIEIEIPDGTIVGQLIGQIRVPQEEIAFVAVNGSRVGTDAVIHEGDEVKLFQLVGGG